MKGTCSFFGLVLALLGCSAEGDGNGGSREGGGSAGVSGGGAGASSGPLTTGMFANPTQGGGTSGGFTPVNNMPGQRPTMTCADANITASRVRPTVYVVVDGSGSMDEDLGGQSRWDALRAALMDSPGGVIPELESVVDFGLSIYDAPLDGPTVALLQTLLGMPVMGAIPDCVTVTDVPPAPMNFLTINGSYWSAPPGGSTPTHTALEQVVAAMPDAAAVAADPNLGEQYIILATDGAPNDLCWVPPAGQLPRDPFAEVINVVNTAVGKGIKVFVISLAGGDAQLMQHLDQVATAGGTGYPPFVPTSRDELTNALQMILGEVISCDIVLNGSVTPGAECRGFVAVNGFDRTCNDMDGWVLADPNLVRLQGAACEEAKNTPQAQIEAGFPCDVFAPD